VITVRLATLGDLTRLVIFGREAHANSNYADIPYNSGVVRDTLRAAVMLKGQDVFIAERADGSLCGLLIALTIPLPFSRRKYATDGVFFAEQGGDKLLDAFIDWAKTRHVARIDMGVTQFDPEHRLDALYKSRGLQPTGGMYLMKMHEESQP
jgi:hypothetical protein